jgi:L,D-transpeptidase YcbB
MKPVPLNKPNLLKAGIVLIACIHAITSSAQISPVTLQQALEREIIENHLTLNNASKVKDFYKSYHYNTAWIGHESFRNQLFEYLKRSDELGLKKEDYHFSIIGSVCNGNKQLQTAADSIDAEFIFTDAALHFFSEAAYGSHPPDLGFNGLSYSPSCLNIPYLLSAALSINKFDSFLSTVECKSPEYQYLKGYLNVMSKLAVDRKTTVAITSNKIETGNRPLIQKLRDLQLVDSTEKDLTERELKVKVTAAQRLFSLPEDRVLTAALIREMNVPVEHRIADLQRALNTARWLRCIREQSPHVILVNIPSASLVVYAGYNTVLQSKIIVGKASTRTPVFATKVDEVVMYPYWMVPKSIATKELLPHIKRNINYLNTNGFQVVNLQGKVMNPASINWQALHAGNFPYILRQSTGCDNSLGIVKLNFYSPFGVYLHDTPTKSLFKSNRRFYSHGCMRVEKAMQLAHLLLKDNTIAVDTIEEKGCLRNQKPIPVAVTEKMPLFVLYNTAWVDSTGAVQFYPDIYKKFAH